MNKFRYIVFEEVNNDVIEEVSLWREVAMRNLSDLDSDAGKASRYNGYRKSAFLWIFGKDATSRFFYVGSVKIR